MFTTELFYEQTKCSVVTVIINWPGCEQGGLKVPHQRFMMPTLINMSFIAFSCSQSSTWNMSGLYLLQQINCLAYLSTLGKVREGDFFLEEQNMNVQPTFKLYSEVHVFFLNS